MDGAVVSKPLEGVAEDLGPYLSGIQPLPQAGAVRPPLSHALHLILQLRNLIFDSPYELTRTSDIRSNNGSWPCIPDWMNTQSGRRYQPGSSPYDWEFSTSSALILTISASMSWTSVVYILKVSERPLGSR